MAGTSEPGRHDLPHVTVFPGTGIRRTRARQRIRWASAVSVEVKTYDRFAPIRLADDDVIRAVVPSRDQRRGRADTEREGQAMLNTGLAAGNVQPYFLTQADVKLRSRSRRKARTISCITRSSSLTGPRQPEASTSPPTPPGTPRTSCASTTAIWPINMRLTLTGLSSDTGRWPQPGRRRP
jgi:hypothetical protein